MTSATRAPTPSALTLALTLACLSLLCSAAARPLPFTVTLHGAGGASGTRLGATLALHDLRLADARADVWLRYGAEPGAARLGTVLGGGATVRYTDTFGPLGTMVVEGGGSLAAAAGGDAALIGRAWLGARSTLANAAVSLALEAGNAAPAETDPGRPPPRDELGRQALRALDDQRRRAGATPGALDLGGRLSVTYRPERSLTGQVDVTLRRLAGDAALDARASLRRSGVATDVDAWTALDLEWLDAAPAGALGLGLLHVPRRGPTSWLRGWLGAGPNGVWPGVEARWSRSGALGAATLDLLYRPWLGATAWEAGLSYRHDVTGGDLTWQLGVHGAEEGADWRLALRWQRAAP